MVRNHASCESVAPVAGKILVVEDDENARSALSELLELEGYVVARASDGAQALALLKEGDEFDLVLSDVTMPHMDGYSLIASIRALPAAVDTPILLISADDRCERRVCGLDLGADDYVSKPVNADELLARVRSHLRRRERNRQLHILAESDELTGLHSRRSILSRLRTEWWQASRGRIPISVLAIDVDDFKQINDRHGHAVGDQVLRTLASAMTKALRSGDAVGRVGGDEFLALLPGADLASARRIAQRMQELVSATAFLATAARGEPVGISIGVATATPSDGREGTEDLLSRADQALYGEKRGRRRRAVMKSI
jgi:diguanylate cyclase (GGDEF)-like protein